MFSFELAKNIVKIIFRQNLVYQVVMSIEKIKNLFIYVLIINSLFLKNFCEIGNWWI